MVSAIRKKNTDKALMFVVVRGNSKLVAIKNIKVEDRNKKPPILKRVLFSL